MTQTVYSIYLKSQPNPGVVEIINLYDNRYFSLAIDGQIIATTEKQSYESTVLKRSFIKNCVKISGVDEDNLQFVYINWEDFCETNGYDYDANNYDEYESIIEALLQNPNQNFLWRDKYSQFIKVLAVGIDNLENIL